MSSMPKLLITLLICLSGITANAQTKEILRTDDAPQPIGPYSQGVVINGTIYVAGQVGRNPTTRELVSGGTAAECKQIMENIRAILKETGADMKDIVNTTIYLTDVNDFAEVNDVYGYYFVNNFPARTTVGVAALPGGSHIEISVIAVKNGGK